MRKLERHIGFGGGHVHGDDRIAGLQSEGFAGNPRRHRFSAGNGDIAELVAVARNGRDHHLKLARLLRNLADGDGARAVEIAFGAQQPHEEELILSNSGRDLRSVGGLAITVFQRGEFAEAAGEPDLLQAFDGKGVANGRRLGGIFRSRGRRRDVEGGKRRKRLSEGGIVRDGRVGHSLGAGRWHGGHVEGLDRLQRRPQSRIERR